MKYEIRRIHLTYILKYFMKVKLSILWLLCLAKKEFLKYEQKIQKKTINEKFNFSLKIDNSYGRLIL